MLADYDPGVFDEPDMACRQTLQLKAVQTPTCTPVLLSGQGMLFCGEARSLSPVVYMSCAGNLELHVCNV